MCAYVKQSPCYKSQLQKYITKQTDRDGQIVTLNVRKNKIAVPTKDEDSCKKAGALCKIGLGGKFLFKRHMTMVVYEDVRHIDTDSLKS